MGGIMEMHLHQALLKIKQIESKRTLLKGHFSKVAKEYGVKVTDLKWAYYYCRKEWSMRENNE